VGSSPTPGALLADSTTSLKYLKRQNNNSQLKDATSSAISPTFCDFGRRHVPETLIPALEELDYNYEKLKNDRKLQRV